MTRISRRKCCETELQATLTGQVRCLVGRCKPVEHPNYKGRNTYTAKMCRVGWKEALSLHPYNSAFKQHRRNIAKVAQSTISLAVFDRVQEEESAHFLPNVLDSPGNLFDHIRREAGAVILKNHPWVYARGTIRRYVR